MFVPRTSHARSFGALSAKDGRIYIAWDINHSENGEHVIVRWRETGAAPH
jgi:two-component sensor histidine kinase